MEQTIDIQKPTGKIYKEKAIWVGTFLGGTLVAGYLIAENFKVFDDQDKAKKTWIYAIITTVVLFGGLCLIPDSFNIPNYVIPIIYLSITRYLVSKFQKEKINAHINSGGQTYKGSRILGIGLIGLVITILPFIGATYLSDRIANDSSSTKTYGIMKHEIIFNKSNISENEVDILAEDLKTLTFFDEIEKKQIYVKKVGFNYELSISIIEGIENNKQAMEPFLQLRNGIQTLFPKNKIVFNLCVNNLDNVVKRLE